MPRGPGAVICARRRLHTGRTTAGVRSKEQGVAGGLEDRAELLAVVEAPGLPPAASAWRRQTALGALKMLKGKGYSDVVCAIPADDKSGAQFLTELGMQVMQA